jgi:hypothetical protein
VVTTHIHTQITCNVVFEYLMGFKYDVKKNKADGNVRSGLSWGSLSGYLSLYTNTYASTVDLIIEIDQNLGSASTPLHIRIACWEKHFGTATFPEEWPVKDLFPKAHLYGHGQFKKETQTIEIQHLIVLRI